MFRNILRFVVAVSALTLAHAQTLANGNYQIKSVVTGTLARNFNATGTPTSITFNPFIDVDAVNFVWHVSKGAGDLGFTLTSIASGNRAAVTNQQVGAQVEGFNDLTTQFAIESAGNGNFVIKSPNADLLWAVFETVPTFFIPFLEPASGGDEQKFQFIAV